MIVNSNFAVTFVLYVALRELAYAGRYRSAEMVLEAISDKS